MPGRRRQAAPRRTLSQEPSCALAVWFLAQGPAGGAASRRSAGGAPGRSGSGGPPSVKDPAPVYRFRAASWAAAWGVGGGLQGWGGV